LRSFLVFALIAVFASALSCRKNSSEFVTVALPENFTTFDTLTTTSSDSAAERVRNLIFNTLVRKSESFDYIGELAKEIRTSEDGKTITFILQDNVKFHNGKDLTSADVKYTFDEMFRANGYKSGAFFDTEVAPSGGTSNANSVALGDKNRRIPHITSFETPDPKTVVITVARPALRNQLLSNLVAIPIIAEGTVNQQKDQPVGTGPFKFVRFDPSQNIVEFESNPNYWEGVPKISKLRLKTVQDANSLQAELQTGGVDIAPLPSNLPPDAIRSLGNSSTLKVEQSNGSNLQYLVFNTQSAPLNNVKVRQAIAYAVDRDKIINELLFGQARIAHSILPPESWAYAPGTEYHYDPSKAKQLLSESGYKGEPIKFNYGSTNAAVNQYSQVIQSSLNDIGLTVQIETMDVNVLRKQLATGQFQMYTGIWIGGNQDPIFLRDLFASSKIPGENVNCCNRSRYSNSELDKTLESAINSTSRDDAKQLYAEAQEMVSSDVPLFPLWYPANIVIANRRIGNIKVGPSGDWGFLKDIIVQ
jgi:peptide/nickel transport system substrate-binding protein